MGCCAAATLDGHPWQVRQTQGDPDGFNGAAGRRVRGGPNVRSAARRAGTVATRLGGALILVESNSAVEARTLLSH
jgi:hypothetical protein